MITIFSFSSSLLFLGGKKKGEENKQSHVFLLDQKFRSMAKIMMKRNVVHFVSKISDRAERHGFWSRFLSFILLFFPSFLAGKKKGGENNQSCGQKSWLLLDQNFRNMAKRMMKGNSMHFFCCHYSQFPSFSPTLKKKG